MTGLPLFPVTVVGSWARPPWLLDSLRQRQAGRITFAEFNEVADKAVLECLKYQEDAGVDIVSDGEQRRDNFYSFVVEKLDGAQLMSLAELMNHVQDKESFDAILRSMDAPAFAIHNTTVVDKVTRREPLALDEYLFLKEHTDRPIKIALPGPYLLTRSMWVKGVSDTAYPTMVSLAADLVSILREELIALRDAGCEFVQFDEPVLTDVMFRPEVKERTFMCASMAAASGDPKAEMVRALRLMNDVTRGIEGVKTGVHICRGNWSRKEEALLNGAYTALLPYVTNYEIDQLVLEYATPRAGEVESFPASNRVQEIGLGVVNPRSDEMESVDYVVGKVEDALQHFQPQNIYLNPDCGFGTFAERPMNPPEVAFRKLEVISQAAEPSACEIRLMTTPDRNPQLNGIDLTDLQSGLDEIAKQPEARHAGKRSRIQWLGGFRFNSFVRNNTFVVEEPASTTAPDNAPNAMEYVLGALGACLSTGFVLNATRQGIPIINLEVALDSTQDNVFTFFGLSDEGHPGFMEVRAKLYVQADADEATLQAIWEQSVATSPVGNSLARNVTITPEISIVD